MPAAHRERAQCAKAKAGPRESCLPSRRKSVHGSAAYRLAQRWAEPVSSCSKWACLQHNRRGRSKGMLLAEPWLSLFRVCNRMASQQKPRRDPDAGPFTHVQVSQSLQPTVRGHREQQPKWAQQEAPRTALHACSTREVGTSAAVGPQGHSRGAGPSSQQLWACQAQMPLSADMLCLAGMLSCVPQLPGGSQQAVQSDKRSMCTQDAVRSRALFYLCR